MARQQLEIPGISMRVTRRRLTPALSTFRLPALSTRACQLELDDEVHVLVRDADGAVVVSYYACVDDVGFKRHTPANGPAWLERRHALKLDRAANDGDSL